MVWVVEAYSDGSHGTSSSELDHVETATVTHLDL